MKTTDHITCTVCHQTRPQDQVNGWDPVTGDTSKAYCRDLATCKPHRGAPYGNQRAVKPDAERRESRIVIRCTENEKRGIEGMAEQAGLSVSDWGRERLRRD